MKALASKREPELQKQTHGGVVITTGRNHPGETVLLCSMNGSYPHPPPLPSIYFLTFVWFGYYTFKPVTAPALQSWAILFWNILLLVTKWICFISYSSWQEALSPRNHRAKPKYLARWRKSRCLLEPRDSVSILRQKWPAGTAVCCLALHAMCAWMPRNKICPRLAKAGEENAEMVSASAPALCCIPAQTHGGQKVLWWVQVLKWRHFEKTQAGR